MTQEFLEDKCVVIPLSPPLIPMPGTEPVVVN
jgi:hypothetical protein